MQNEYYELTLYGSRVRKFIKYLKKLFPEYICIIHNVDKISDDAVRFHYRYGKYTRYNANILRDHFRRNPSAHFYIQVNSNCDLLTLFKLKKGQKDTYVCELREFFDKIKDVHTGMSFKKYWNIAMTLRYVRAYHILYGISRKILEGDIEYSSSIIYNNFLKFN